MHAEVIIEGESGITAQLHPVGGEVDDTHKPVFEANCGQCHELRSPSNRSMTPNTVESNCSADDYRERGRRLVPMHRQKS